jgi:hypothetical protein
MGGEEAQLITYSAERVTTQAKIGRHGGIRPNVSM